MNFFRVQHAGYTFEQMQSFNSESGGDGHTEGLCVSDSPEPRSFGGAWDAMDDTTDEVIILKGQIITEIYDGYRIRPTEEVARFTIGKWRQMLADGSAYDYEDWS